MAGRLGDILVRQGILTEAQLQSALASQRAEKGLLGAILVRRGWISVDQLGAAMEEQFEVPFRRIAPEEMNPQVVRLLPEELARHRQVVPLEASGGAMTLAMAAPDDVEMISEAELICGYRVEPVIALEHEIAMALDHGFDERTSARQTVVDMQLADLHQNSRNAEVGADPGEASPQEDAPVVRLVRSILHGALSAGASDVHVEPHIPEMRVRYRIDGELQQVMTIPHHIEEAVVARIKVMADMDTTETRRPQDGNLELDDSGAKAQLRVSTIPTVGGEKVVMRILYEGHRVFSLDQLGLCARDAATLKQLVVKPQGMILMSGPTGSGKTTTMYSVLSELNAVSRNIVTVEDPVEYRLPGVYQVASDNQYGMGFANALKYILRQDPDVILVGEIRDQETAAIAVQAALTGHLLISTLHANDAVGTVGRLCDLGVDPFKIGGALEASIAQRLLRVLCPQCKQPCTPSPAMLESLSAHCRLPEDATFYEGRGCRKCLGLGYSGRTPIFEIMTVTAALAEAIERNQPATRLREIARAEGMVELAEAGLQQAIAGNTTVEEVFYKVSS